MDKLAQSRARTLIQHPFLATIMLGTKEVADKSIPTACTDSKTIRYNPEFMNSLPIDVCIFVRLHEVGHIIFMHNIRRGHRDPRLWNIACDYAINRWLKSTDIKIWENCCYDPKYDGMSEEVIYDLLVKEQKERNAKGLGPIPEDILGGDVIEPENLGPEEIKRITRDIQGRIAEAATAARMAGKMTGELEKLVVDALKPQVPWQELLRDYMTRTSQDDETWARRNRRISHVFLPSRHSTRVGEIAVIRDISGSISHEEQAKTVAEVESISHTTRPELIRVIAADTKVKHEDVFAFGDDVKIAPMKGGGTDMRVPLTYVEQFDPEVVILVTDGHTPWPAIEPPYPLIVCCTTDVAVPIGLVVRI